MKIKTPSTHILQRVISNLLRDRNLLCLQLNREFGNINEKEYLEGEKELLLEAEDYPKEILEEAVSYLEKVIGCEFEPDEISVMFNVIFESVYALDRVTKI